MDLLEITALITYTFGTYAFGSVLALELRHRAAGIWSGASRESSRHAEFAGMALLIVSFCWFCSLLAAHLLAKVEPSTWWPRTLNLILLYSFPPLIAHLVYAESQGAERRLNSAVWRAVVGLQYVASVSILTWLLLGFYGITGTPSKTLGAVFGTSITLQFVVTAAFGALALVGAPKKQSETAEERTSRRWTVGLFGVMLVLSALMYGAGEAPLARVIQFVASCLPLLFFFVALYHDDRFVFFDLVAKRGFALLLSLFLLAGYFALILPFADHFADASARPWIWAVLLAPAAVALPWLHRRIGRAVDDHWLGRRFAPVDAVKRFLSGLRDATDEKRLVRNAEEGLTEIFGAQARVVVAPHSRLAPADPSALEVPIRSGPNFVGTIRLGARINRTPFFSEDRALLESLADVLSSMLDNMRLQARRQEQEQRAQELSLHASRSELKALRAQINPHFLFNALNAIAGLIHQDPRRADETVEQLAEVFRYTLRSSDLEWAVLADELDFVRSYLNVEQARFGSRLEVDIDVNPEVRSCKIVTMMIQTLVENAVKHGVAQVRGPARLAIRAWRSGDLLRIEVEDNGPGFRQSTDTPRRSPGYGLRNVRERLEGTFGERARLQVDHDTEPRRTLVSIEMPFEQAQARGVAS